MPHCQRRCIFTSVSRSRSANVLLDKALVNQRSLHKQVCCKAWWQAQRLQAASGLQHTTKGQVLLLWVLPVYHSMQRFRTHGRERALPVRMQRTK
jgi:hypothetical protein